MKKEQARLLAGELPCLLLVLLDMLTLANFSVCLQSSCAGSLQLLLWMAFAFEHL